MRLPNPFLVASGPPTTNAAVIARAYEEGWGGVVSKTACLDASRIVNVSPRYARMRVGGTSEGAVRAGRGEGATSGFGSGVVQDRPGRAKSEIVGWQNIELISDRPFDEWLDDFKRVKENYPDRVLIASVTEGCDKDAWVEIVERTQATGVDAIELNLSCPHGLPERRMGSAIGQVPGLVRDVCRWATGAARVPVWAKLTPNVTDIVPIARAAIEGGCHGVSAINTLLSIMSVNLETLRPEPTVEGNSTAGGYSGRAVRPIALRMTSQIAGLIDAEQRVREVLDPDARESVIEAGSGGRGGGKPIVSSMGGIESGGDAAQFLLLGASCVQVCTGVMVHGYRLIDRLRSELEAFMSRHGFETIEEFRGHSLAYLRTHSELVQMQTARRDAVGGKGKPVRTDGDWSGDRLVEQSEMLS